MDVSKLVITFETNSNRKLINNRYRIIRKIGNGQYGKVLLSQDITQDNKDVAIKTINRIDRTRLITKTYLDYTKKINREIQIMKECNHPNVVQLYQVIDDLKYDKILLVIEYCKFGEIEWKTYNHYYEKYYKKNGLTINKILRDVINGLEYLHNYKNIIHRDLKPSNLLISNDNTIKISDFGVSLILENNANDKKELGKTMGTPAFFAPELCQFVNNRLSMIQHLDNSIQIDSKIDLWSLGVTLYCLIFNSLPFNGRNEFDLFKNIVNSELKFPKITNNSKTTDEDVGELKELKNLIKSLLIKDPRNRISIEDIKRHKFTLFDLNEREKKIFLNVTSSIIKEQKSKEDNLTSKMKRFFTGGKTGNTKKEEKTESVPDIEHLKHVDELIDSYLDDSSSLGSDIEVEEYDVPEDEEPAKIRPSPLDLSYSNLLGGEKESSTAMPAEEVSPKSGLPPPTPTNGETVTIGAGSQLSLQSFFSPSKRYFAKNKALTAENKTPSINSLSALEEIRQDHLSYASMLEPPSVFNNKHSSQPIINNNSINNSGSPRSRKNSFQSIRSNNLTRITSSSSSLNLNAYLSLDCDSLLSVNYNKDEKPSQVFDSEDETDEEVNKTLTYDDVVEEATKYKSMTGYLDSL